MPELIPISNEETNENTANKNNSMTCNQQRIKMIKLYGWDLALNSNGKK